MATNERLRDYVQDRLSGAGEHLDGELVGPLVRSGTERASPIGRIAAG